MKQHIETNIYELLVILGFIWGLGYFIFFTHQLLEGILVTMFFTIGQISLMHESYIFFLFWLLISFAIFLMTYIFQTEYFYLLLIAGNTFMLTSFLISHLSEWKIKPLITA